MCAGGAAKGPAGGGTGGVTDPRTTVASGVPAKPDGSGVHGEPASPAGVGGAGGAGGCHAASHSASAMGSSEPSVVVESGAWMGLSGPLRGARMGGDPAGGAPGGLGVLLANWSLLMALVSAETAAPQLSQSSASAWSVAPQ